MSPADKPIPRKLPGSLDGNRTLSRWLHINSDGTVTVYPGKVEIGQGILTALVQIVAEELDVSIERIRLAPASTAYSPDEGITSGSRSIQEGGMALRYAAAEARDLLLERAAAKLGVSVEQLEVADGDIRARSGAHTSYWEVASDELLEREATPGLVPKPPEEHVYVGTAVQRRDIPAKVTGVPSYVHDMDMADMVHGRVVRPAGRQARLVSIDEQEVRAMPGVITVARDGAFLGVVAAREEQAIRAQRRLARAARWEVTPTLPESTDPRYLLARNAEDEVISEKSDPAAGKPAKTLSAEYSRPFIAHASIGPSCAIALFAGGKHTVWTHSQGIYPLRANLARALGAPESAIVVTHVEGAGCYGHNGADDVALDAALLARAAPGKPVRVQWMREDEFQWEPLGSGMVVRMGAALDAKGNIVDWTHELWSHGHSTRPGSDKEGANLLAAWHLAEPVKKPRPGNPGLPGGGSHRNAIPLYDFPRQRVVNHLIREAPLRTSALRSLGAHANVFAIESFMDELAQAAGADPVEFRLRHLTDPRAIAVIQRAAA
ncbi:MAG TPA: molybdopterin cofactor-binding domain-containing protein, partial [Longimicrobiales bacterium]